MKKHETLHLLNLIENTYPLVIFKSETILKWMNVCESIDYTTMLKKLVLHIRTNPYPPMLNQLTIAAIEVQSSSRWLEEYSIRSERTQAF